jgi:hypothetical protein
MIYARNVGDLVMQRDLFKGVDQSRTVIEPKSYLDKEYNLSLLRHAELKEVDRKCFFCHPVDWPSLKRTLMEFIEQLFWTTLCVKGMRDELRYFGNDYNDK